MPNDKYCLRLGVFTAVTMENVVFWDVAPYGSLATNVSEKRIISIIRVKRISELETTLAVTSC
jgi:hypothetical protein